MDRFDELNKIKNGVIYEENKKATQKITAICVIGFLILLGVWLYFLFKIAIPMQNQLNNLMELLK